MLSVAELGLHGQLPAQWQRCQWFIHIAERENRWLIGLEMFVGTNIAASVERYRCFFQAQAFDIRVATGGAEHSINHHT